MSFIKNHKKIVTSTIASSLSIIAGNAIAQENTSQLPTIDLHASPSTPYNDFQSFKTDRSANTKYVAPLLDTPKSIDVISQKLLAETHSNTLTEALRNTPGVTLAAGEGGTPFTDMPYIRGYSAQSSIYVDGIRNSVSQNRDMFDVEKVEVTKGSSSAISGGGGAGGSINLITKEAHAGDRYQGTIAGGTDDYRHITLDANKDFGNGIASRVVVMGHQNEKPGEKDGAEYNRVGIAPSIVFGLGTPTRARLSYYYLQSDDNPDAGIPFPIKGGAPYNVAKGTYYGWKGRDFDRRQNQVGTFKLEHDFNEDLNLSNTLNYNYASTNYIMTNPDDSQGNIANNNRIFRRAVSQISSTNAYSDQMALSGKFNTGGIKHSFSTGADWTYQETDTGIYAFNGFNPNKSLDIQDQTNNGNSESCKNPTIGYCTTLNNPNPYDTYSDKATAVKGFATTRNRNVGLYALDSIEFSPQWLLNLGLRWDQFNTSIKYNYPITLRGTQYTAGQGASNDKSFFSYQAGLVFKPTENGSIYASFATSAIPVGSDQFDQTATSAIMSANDLKPEEARTYEVGTKWNIFKNRANATAAVFRTEKQNTRIGVTNSATGITTLSNVGTSHVNGFELGLNGNLTEKWDISAGYSYLDSKLTKTSSDLRSLAGLGKALPYVSKNSATLWTTYKVQPQLTLGVGTQYNDRSVVSYVANSNVPKYIPTYTLYNAMIKYNVNRNIDLQLNINNITDKRYFSTGHYHYAMQGDGRNAVLALNFKY
ncbi:TonB-dependent receptor [Acinetobacter pollinis]|uniref:TonB-dependent receptor n=2 Tax=Acinetobacter pollinis TaxID=2605270 RepID=UPI0018A297D0|nr:TonB-dependent siderophore receptor [Acinetobacter pollinis]MBF7692377.1 TonB-dependent siderophore receptor [Acinetobacter pollinis]MBF7698257.1 TonB-dependent siderophore receptor [Acinetobacter pollinis]MBF7701030.1 TonB-dependent siderophore receptor [Acinetobacter pollinis]